MSNLRPEILAPAGNAEMLAAAVYAGANAVYLGLESFNARRTAGNFTTEALGQAVVFCHARNVKVYVTLNTIVYPQELQAMADTVRAVALAGADAVIVQDMAVAALVGQIAPTLALHASTQMSVHSFAGAKKLAELGFARVILSRECSLAEIEHITKHCGIETETFVHGALCMSVSGQCYMSAFLGGRSGNRGACAGPCRLPFSAGEPGEHHLSLKDMSYIEFLPQLAAAGVSSVKIEGRLRTPEYAAAAVNACLCELNGEAYDKQLLQDVFSRSGFTDGYINSKMDAAMFGTRTGDDSAAAKAAVPKLRELFRRERPCVPVALRLETSEDGVKLTVSDTDGSKAVLYGESEPQPAQKDPEEAYKRALSKMGGTPFFAESIAVVQDGLWFFAAGEINELRRKALEMLLAKRSAPKPHKTFAPLPLPQQTHAKPPQKIFAQFDNIAQMPENPNVHGMILPLADWEKVPAHLRAKTWLCVPRGVFGEAETIAKKQIDASSTQGFAGYFVQNMAHLALCKGLPMFGAFGLNIANPLSASFYANMGLTALTLSPEITVADMARIALSALTAVIAYAHMPLMLTRACPLHNVHGCKGCTRKGELLDRKGMRFPVRCTAPSAAGMRTVYNPIPIYMGDRQNEIPADIALLHFTIETKAETEKIVADFIAARPQEGDFTRGLYYKGTN